MAAMSKFLIQKTSLPCNCYEVIHTWTPVCAEAILDVGFSVFIDSIKMYSLLCLVSQIILRKLSPEDFWKSTQSVLISSCFLSFNLSSFLYFICLFRKYMGKFSFLYTAFLPGFLASLLAIYIEKESRRKALTLFMMNITSEILFRMAVKRGFLKPIPSGKILLCSTSMALYFYITRKEGYPSDGLGAFLKFLIGTEETNSLANVTNGCHDILKPPCQKSNNCSFPPLSLRTLWSDTKHPSCPHILSCMQYSLQGFLRPFLIGYLAYGTSRILSGRSGISSMLHYILTDKQSLRFGLFLGGFTWTFRTMNCACRWIFGKDQATYALPAAFIGGFFLKIFPSSSVALYFTWKTIEVLHTLGTKQGIVPNVSGFSELLYAVCSAVIAHAMFFEPHIVRPSYRKFLTHFSHDPFSKVNRQLLDQFGSHASKLCASFC